MEQSFWHILILTTKLWLVKIKIRQKNRTYTLALQSKVWTNMQWNFISWFQSPNITINIKIVKKKKSKKCIEIIVNDIIFVYFINKVSVVLWKICQICPFLLRTEKKVLSLMEILPFLTLTRWFSNKLYIFYGLLLFSHYQ